MLVNGQPGARPIDSLLANLNDLYGQLVFAAENPQSKQALDQIEVQVASLRANASRLPEPFAGMIDKLAHDAASDANASSIAQIADSMSQNVTGICQQIVSNSYPFTKGDREVSLVDFSRLFAPGGVIDKFFGANIEPLVSRSGKTWVGNPIRICRASCQTRPCASSRRRLKSATLSFRPAVIRRTSASR